MWNVYLTCSHHYKTYPCKACHRHLIFHPRVIIGPLIIWPPIVTTSPASGQVLQNGWKILSILKTNNESRAGACWCHSRTHIHSSRAKCHKPINFRVSFSRKGLHVGGSCKTFQNRFPGKLLNGSWFSAPARENVLRLSDYLHVHASWVQHAHDLKALFY